MHNKRHTHQSDQQLTAWVQAIARYKLIDLLRSKSGREALHDPLDDELAVFAESSTDASDAGRDLTRLLDILPDRQRLPIEQVKLAGLSVAETTALLGRSETAVRVGIHRGLRALGKRVANSSGACTGALSGPAGAAVYAFHCPETALPFMAIWYVSGTVIAAGVGAVLGPRLLRW